MKSDKVVLITGVLIGFVLVPPLARANAQLVNGFLFLILFGSLLYRRDRWLPYFAQFTKAAGGGGSSQAQYAPPISQRDYNH